jgi:hypothetical protein
LKFSTLPRDRKWHLSKLTTLPRASYQPHAKNNYCMQTRKTKKVLCHTSRTYLLLQIKRQKLRQRPEGSPEQKRKRATMAQDQRASKAVATLWKIAQLYQVRGCYILGCFYKPLYILHQISGETLWPSFYSLQNYSEAQGYRIRLLSSTFSPNDLGYKMPTSCWTSLQKKERPLLQNAPVNKAEPHLLQKCNPPFLHLSHLIQKNLFEPLSPSPVGVHPRRFWFLRPILVVKCANWSIFWPFQEVRPKSSTKVCSKARVPEN